MEEVVVDADPLDAEDLLPDLGDQQLARRPRRDEGRFPLALPFRRGQRPAVELAVRRQRKLVDEHDRRRDHVSRKPLLEVAAQGVSQTLLARRILARELLLRDDIRRQPHVVGRRLDRQHGAVGDRLVLLQDGLDLAELDPEAADLDLVVDAAAELELAVGQAPRDIAGSIQPLRREGALEKRSAVSSGRFR